MNFTMAARMVWLKPRISGSATSTLLRVSDVPVLILWLAAAGAIGLHRCRLAFNRIKNSSAR
jgi:hypothetical protein